MKKIFRMIIFSGLALYLTSLWNKGFILNGNWKNFILAALILALIFYLIVPFSKLIFLPFNIITLGFLSVVIYFFLFHFFLTRYSLVGIKEWFFPGLSFGGIIIKQMKITYIVNVIISAISVSCIINFLESLL